MSVRIKTSKQRAVACFEEQANEFSEDNDHHFIKQRAVAYLEKQQTEIVEEEPHPPHRQHQPEKDIQPYPTSLPLPGQKDTAKGK